MSLIKLPLRQMSIITIFNSILLFLLSSSSLQSSETVFLDISDDTKRQIIVDKEDGQYLGHPTTTLIKKSNTILCVYPKGHGKGEIVYKRSLDGGRTWSERLQTPASWKTSKEVPTLFQVKNNNGEENIIMFSGLAYQNGKHPRPWKNLVRITFNWKLRWHCCNEYDDSRSKNPGHCRAIS